MRLFYARREEGKLVLLDAVNGSPARDVSKRDVVVLSRLECMVKAVEIPPVAEKEVAPLLKFRLRGLYPGDPEETAYDYRILGGGKEKRALVCILDSAALDEYRTEAGEARLVLTSFLPIRKKSGIAYEEVYFIHPDWIEKLELNGEESSRSLFSKRTGNTIDDLKELDGTRPEGEAGRHVRLVFIREQDEDLASDFEAYFKHYDENTVVSSETLLSVLKKSSRAGNEVFPRKKARRLPSRGKRIVAAMALMAALFFVSLHNDIGRLEKEYRELKQVRSSLEKESGRIKNTTQKNEKLKAELSVLKKKQGVDVYALFSDVVSTLPGDPDLVSFTLKENAFQMEGWARNPLEMVQRLEAHPRFSNVRLHTVLPSGDGKDRFLLTGVYRAE